MLELQLKDIVGSYKALANLMVAKLPIKAAYHLKRLAAKIEPDMKMYSETVNNLLKELGTEELDKDGKPTGQYRFTDPSKGTEFERQHTDLLETNIKLDIELLSIAAFGENAEVTASDLLACDKFIKE